MSKETYIGVKRQVFLDGGGVRLLIGEFELDEDAPLDDWAKAAFSHSRASLKKLMPQMYRIVVVREGGDHAVGLTRFVKLVDTIAQAEKAEKKQARAIANLRNARV